MKKTQENTFEGRQEDRGLTGFTKNSLCSTFQVLTIFSKCFLPFLPFHIYFLLFLMLNLKARVRPH